MSYSDLYETNFNFYKSRSPGWKDIIQPAAQFAIDPIGSSILHYAKKRAIDHIINKTIMPRTLPGDLMDVDELRRKPRSRNHLRERGRVMRPDTSGRYTGRIPFPRKKPKTSKSIFAQKGSRGKIEQNVQAVEGTNVSYLGFTSMIRAPQGVAANKVLYGSAPFHVGMAIVRLMFKKEYNVDIEHPSQTITDLNMVSQVGSTFTNGIPTGGSIGLNQPNYINFVRKVTPIPYGSTGNPALPTYEVKWGLQLSATTTMMQIAWEIAQNVICSRDFGAMGGADTGSGSVNQIYELYGAYFYDADTNFTGSTIHVRKGMILLGDYNVAVRCNSTIYFQNQTASDSGGATAYSTDVVDANPIRGRIYYFSHPNPVVRTYQGQTDDKSWKLMHDANGDGVIYPDTNAIGTTGTGSGNLGSGFNQLPGGDMFMNLKKYDTISLAPGEMKRFDFNFKFNGNINKFITGLRLLNTTGVAYDYVTLNPNQYQYQVNAQSKALGSSVLFAFEKRLSTGAGNPIVTYQRNTYTSATLTYRKKKTMLPMCVGEVAIDKDDTTTGPP